MLTAKRFVLCAMLGVFGVCSRGETPATIPATGPTTAPNTGDGVPPAKPDALSVTEGQIAVNGQAIKYRATAGRLLVQGDNDKPKAQFFFVSYEKLPRPADAAKRPITFLFNGGPGAAAVWLHLGAVGPYRVALDHNTDLPLKPYHLEENPDTWLSATDLVLIDPVSTGYSRAADGENPQQFYGVNEDIHWTAEFIRLYITRYQRWLSPKYLAGESYGTTRAAGLSDYLQQSNGITINGIVLISSVLNFGTIDAGESNDLPYVLYLPSYTAVAWYHHKLAPDLQADLKQSVKLSKDFAENDYANALLHDADLSADQRAKINQNIERFTGLPAEIVEKSNLRIRPDRFEAELLADRQQVVGRFDARITGYNAEPLNNSSNFDPSLFPYLGAYTATFNDYVREKLKYTNDSEYAVLTGKVQPWNLGTGGSGYLDVTRTLSLAMMNNPQLRVMFVNGYFDLATPFAAADYTIAHMNLSPELRKNITHNFYDAGHMVYHYHPALEQLGKDVREFVGRAE